MTVKDEKKEPEKKKLVWSWDDPQFKMKPEDIKELERRHLGKLRVTIRPLGKTQKTKGDEKQ